MNKFSALMLLSFISLKIAAQKKLTEGAELLFRNIKTTLTITEKNQLYEQSGLGLSKDRNQFVLAGDAFFLDHPFGAKTLPADINKDGKEEIFIIFGNSYISGETGSNVLLFIKDKTGKYQSNFGFSGAAPAIMPTKNAGYPDLLIGGPGFEFPIWRWNGKAYVFYKKITEQRLAKVKTTNIEQASKVYMNGIKQ